MNNYLERAIQTLTKVGIVLPKQQNNPIMPLLEKIEYYNPERVMVIATAMQMSSSFNDLVRNNIDGMEIANRYTEISNGFNTVIEDLSKMNGWMADGVMSFGEKIQMAWMSVRRGSIPDRFEGIRKNYLAVAESANDQIQRESAILEAYKDFRLAFKSAEVEANEVLTKDATPALAAKRTALDAANKAVESFAGEDSAERARLELARDEALRALQDEDKAYQFVKNLADDLRTSYNTSELIYARFQQTNGVKTSLYERSVEFFATSETVVTGLSAAFTQNSGLIESTNAHEAMKDGMSRGLEALAQTGNGVLEKATRSAYGETLRVSSVKALADKVVEWQQTSVQLSDELRKQSTASAAEIQSVTEDAKQRFIALVNKGA